MKSDFQDGKSKTDPAYKKSQDGPPQLISPIVAVILLLVV